MAALLLILLTTLLGPGITGLQVTPNSPCSSFCLDAENLDFSDPKSSNTLNQDITCYDSEYTTSAAGQKFQKCLTCLQNSEFAQSDENDQAWFLYNLRYTFDHCVFGFPNASDVASTPCSTSTACGTLERALTGDELDATGLDPYGYCHADGAAMTNTSIERCISCVSASEGQKYLANFMVALQAGCIQQPAIGTAVGLNSTVFSSTVISITDPAASAIEPAGKPTLTTPAIVGISVAVIAVILGVLGVLIIRCRKRQNRRLRLEPLSQDKSSSSGPISPLSFRCQTHLSPQTSRPFTDATGSPVLIEKGYMGPGEALGSNPPSAFVSKSAWKRSSGFGSGRNLGGGGGSGPSLHSITIETSPTAPDSVHYSTSPKAKGFSSVEVTPVSATSTKATSQLLPLRPYNPAEYVFKPPQMNTAMSPDVHTYSSPTSASTASPLISRAWDQGDQTWDAPMLPPRGLVTAPPIKTLVAGGGKGQERSRTGRPVESNEIKTWFPGPPAGR